jgi:S1-C subfamily serine protease
MGFKTLFVGAVLLAIVLGITYVGVTTPRRQPEPVAIWYQPLVDGVLVVHYYTGRPQDPNVRSGDKIVSINNSKLRNFPDFMAVIKPLQSQEVELVIIRDGETVVQRVIIVDAVQVQLPSLPPR